MITVRKYAIVYRKDSTGEEFWASSFDENGCPYCLRPKTTDIPTSHIDATEYYGKHAYRSAQKTIDNDVKHKKWYYGYTPKIIEYDREPEWYFEIQYVLKHQYHDGYFDEVRKSFPLNPEIEYEIRKGHSRPLIDDLDLPELIRYYNWRKEHFKGKVKLI